MAFWEFLLQKDGDRSWLPLESPTVEILEGRYRVVGRSSRINTPIEIRIAHDVLTDAVTVRRTQKRSGCTNQDGLVVIMPFTQLQPGDWELYCTGDLMADMMGEGWQYGVKLQVLPIVEEAEAWEPDLQPAAHLPTLSVGFSNAAALSSPPLAIPFIAVPETPVETPVETPILQPAASLVLEDTEQPVLTESQLNSAEGEGSEIPSPEVILSEALPPLSLHLEQEMYVVRRGEALILRGEIGSATVESPELPLQIRVRLYAPQNSQVLFDLVYPLSPAALPIPFTCTVPLPHHYETYLVLGEAIVELTSASGTEKITSQSFKVTTDLHELLESFASQFSEGGNGNSVTDLPDVLPPLEAISLPSELPGFAQPTVPPTVQFQPAQSILPPQLRSVSPEQKEATKERRAIELPTFAQEPAAQEAIPQETIPQEPAPQEPLQESQSVPASTTESGKSANTPAPVIDNLSITELFLTEVSGTANHSPEISVAERGIEPAQRDSVSKASPDSTTETALPQNAPSARLPQNGTGTTSPQSSKPIIDDTDPALDWQHVDLQKPRKSASEAPLAPEDIAFRSLNLQQRFLSRLQSLASDSQLSAALQTDQTIPAQPNEPNAIESPITSVFDPKPLSQENRTQPIGEDAHLAHDEFVIDEGWEEMETMQQLARGATPKEPPLGGTAKHSTPSKFWQTASQSPPTPGLTLSPDEPLPVPVLRLPSENLMSGSSTLVLVKLPDCPAKLAVKLWLIDRQSRLLLDGPHWLTDFTPDGFGQWMNRIELFLPQGYLEVQVEAISVEIMTQRESEKTVEARSIEPPLSQFTYDSIDV